MLYTLPPSHYCERARWALDHCGITYKEERLALGPHAARLRLRGVTDTALPILEQAATRVQGSDRILDFCNLVAVDPALEARFETTIGQLARRFVYAAALSSPNDGGILDILLDGVSRSDGLAGRAAWPLVRHRLANALGAHADELPGIIDRLRNELDWVDMQVEESSSPLSGCFGRAHITAASLLSPLVRPREGAVTKTLALTGAAADALRDWSQRPCFRWTRLVYARHRNAW